VEIYETEDKKLNKASFLAEENLKAWSRASFRNSAFQDWEENEKTKAENKYASVTIDVHVANSFLIYL
jgi:hypothetical protein